MKIKICDYSGYRIHPGHGFQFVRGDSKSFNYYNNKVLVLAMKKKNPRKIAWTQVYRKLHKKDYTGDGEKKKRTRRAQKSQRAIVGASLEAIRAKTVQTKKAPAAAKNVKAQKKEKSSKAAKSLKLQAARALQNKPVQNKNQKGARR